MTSTYPRLRTCILPSFNPAAVCVACVHVCVCLCVCACVCVHVCVCMCVCACVCVHVCVLWRDCCLNFKAWLIGAWCTVYTFANVQNVQTKIVWVCYIHPSQLQTLRVIDFMLLVSASSAADPSDRLAAVRIEGIKREVTMMPNAACSLSPN